MNNKIISSKSRINEIIQAKLNPDFSLKNYNIILNPYLDMRKRRLENLFAHRSSLWEEGSLPDVKLGNYFVDCKPYFSIEDLHREKQSIHIFDWLDTEFLHGWSVGLQDPIYFESNGKHFLFADKHNLALPFVLEMIDKKIVPMNASFFHYDDHMDMEHNNKFSFKHYAALSGYERFKYVFERSNIANWQKILLDRGYLDNSRWGNFSGDKTLFNFPGVDKPDICDIDIDVLARFLHIPFNGKQSPSLDPVFQQIIEKASNAKVVMLFTSPCYIPQKQAIHYGKKIVESIL